MRIGWILLLLSILSCREVHPNIKENIFETTQCEAGNKDLSDYIVVGDSFLEFILKSVKWCIDWKFLSGSEIAFSSNQSPIIRGLDIGLRCPIQIPGELFLVRYDYLLKLKRALEICSSNRFVFPDENTKVSYRPDEITPLQNCEWNSTSRSPRSNN